MHEDLVNTSKAPQVPLLLEVWASGCRWSGQCSWSVSMPCFRALPYISVVAQWWREVTTLPCATFPFLDPVRELWGLLVELGSMNCCVQPAHTGHYAWKYFKSYVTPSGDRFKFSLGSRQTWAGYLWARYKMQLAFLNWSIARLGKIE